MSRLHTETIPVLVDHTYPTADEDGMSIATFQWEKGEGRATETYTIALNDFVSLELDSHIPVRPQRVKVYDQGAMQSAETMITYMGEELTNVLLNSRTVGIELPEISLGANQRFAIADLQAIHPSSPIIIRQACRAMTSEHRLAEAELEDVTFDMLASIGPMQEQSTV